MDLVTRPIRTGDAYALLNLYLDIAKNPGAFARAVEEISPDYVEEIISGAVDGGLGIVAVDPEDQNKLIGFIVAQQLGPYAFRHILGELTIGVHPDYQRRGVGRRLFLDFLEHVTDFRSDVLRVELVVRESNFAAIEFYESLGFRREGVFEKRIRRADGRFEADIPMAWIKVEV